MLSVVPPHARRLLLPALLVLALPGCATKEYVQQELAWVNSRLEGIENTLGHADKRINANTGRLSATEARLGKAEQNAAALDRKLGETQQDLAATNNNVAGLLMGLNAANLRIDSNVEKIQTAEQRLVQTQQEAAVIQKRLDDTQGDLEGAKQNLAGLLVSLNEANARIDAQAATLAGDTRATGAVAAFAPSQPGADATPGAGAAPSTAAPEATPAAATAATAATAAPVAAAPSPSPVLAETGQKTMAADAAPAQGGLLGSEMQERLARVNVLIDEVHRRITVNTSSLQNANMRIGALEAGLAATGQRSEEADAALKATRDKVDAAQAGLEAADKRIAANTTALEVMGPHIDAVRADMQGANGRLDGLQARLAEVDAHLLRNDAEHAHLSRTAQEALDRALAAGKLAEGRLVMETVLSEAIGFGFGQSGLSESGRLALLAFADKLKSLDQNVYVEIQGHTDSSGPEEANLRLSRQRAEAVRDFLHQQGGLSLHRLAVAAYGESRPVADNATRDGRIQNRRVVLVVLK